MNHRSIVWFRRDLRLSDNPALNEATWNGSTLPVFVVDPAFHGTGPMRAALLAEAVSGLAERIRDTGGELVIRHGDPRREIPALAAEVQAKHVFVTRDFSPYGIARDAAVAELLSVADRQLVESDSPYAVRPGAVVKDDRAPYSVFTAYHRRWGEHLQTETLDAPYDVEWYSAPTDGHPRRSPVLVEASGLDMSEAGAWRQWERFRSGVGGPGGRADSVAPIDTYDSDRDLPAAEGTSRMSTFLKFGLVHPRQLLAELDPAVPGHAAFERELAWRDFYADVLHHHPNSWHRNLNRRFDAIEVDSGSDALAKFERWCTGTTGFGLVDAGMRQLIATGWMHNRVRMVVASFLVKDLHLPWQWGARFFMRHLGDGDLASNSHGWQWAAGSGTDAAPYFRVFNPDSQQRKWDPNGTYVARWVPEYGSASYPAPMVDHGVERAEALARFNATADARPTPTSPTAGLGEASHPTGRPSRRS